MKKFTVILITLFATTMALICFCCCKTNKANAVYSVKFFIDGTQYSEISAKYGSELDFPEIEDADDDDKVFIGWFDSPDYDKWFTAETVTKNVNVYGYWSSYEDSLITVTFYEDGNVVEGYQIQKGNFIESYQLPETDDGYSLDAWLVDGKPYDFNIRPLTDLELHATRKPTEYTVEFISLDEVVSTQIYTVENYDIKEPACPEHDHYYPGKWESYELTKGNIQVHAVYEPINYTVEYVDGSGAVLGKFDYNITNYKEIVPPEPTLVPGYYSYWDELECGMTKIPLKVAALTYTIGYYVNDDLVETFVTDMVNFHKIVAPEIPQVPGYSASWENYKLQLETDIKVHAVYDLITYYVNFEADDNVVGICEYNVENTEIEIPEIPEKAGYTGEWEDFSLEIGDLTVSAEYTPIDYTASFVVIDELVETQTKLTYTTTFNAENMNVILPDTNDYPFVAGCAVKWNIPTLEFNDVVINGYYYDTDYTYLNFIQVKETDESYNVTAHYFYVAGLSDSGKKDKVTSFVIPDKYHNIPVTFIDNEAFLNNKFIKSVEIYGIESIYASAFSYCSSLQSVKLHDGISTIQQRAFGDSSNLTIINIPETVTQIGESAFAGIGVVSITLPSALYKISENLFYNCAELKNVIVSDSVTEISHGAFSGCSSLTNASLGSNVEIIRDYAFAYCYALKEITIPNKVNIIECRAFLNCGNLKSINISDVNSNWYLIQDNNFSNKITIPAGILANGSDLADNLNLIPDWGLYKEIN